MFVNEASYATRTTPKPVKSIHTVDNNQTTAPIQIENMNLQDLQQKTGLTFTALLLDCEGCINAVFGNKVDTNSLRSTLSNVRTIILEGDMSDRDPMCTSFCVDYGSWRDKLAEIGFRIVYEEQDQKFASIIHYVFQRD